jgi:hypothetical protein
MNTKNIISKYNKLKKYGFSDESLIALCPELISAIDNVTDTIKYYFLTAKNSTQYLDQIELEDTKSIKLLKDLSDREVDHFNNDEINDSLKRKLNKIGHNYNVQADSIKMDLKAQLIELFKDRLNPVDIQQIDILSLLLVLFPYRFKELEVCTMEQAAIAINCDYSNCDYVNEDNLYLLELVSRDKRAFYSSYRLTQKYKNPEEYLATYNYTDDVTNINGLSYKYELKIHNSNFLNKCEPDDVLYAIVASKKPSWFSNHEPVTQLGKLLSICISADNDMDAVEKITELYQEETNNSKETNNNFDDNLHELLNTGVNSSILETLIELNYSNSDNIERIYREAKSGIVKLKCISLYPNLVNNYKLSRLEYIYLCLTSINALSNIDSIPDKILVDFLGDNPMLIDKISRDLTVDELEVYLSNVEEIPENHLEKVVNSINELDELDRNSILSMFSYLSTLKV